MRFTLAITEERIVPQDRMFHQIISSLMVGKGKRGCRFPRQDANVGSNISASPSSVLLRQKILGQCQQDIYEFFEKHNGQVAIYDAVNSTAAGRRLLAEEFIKNDIHVGLHDACGGSPPIQLTDSPGSQFSLSQNVTI